MAELSGPSSSDRYGLRARAQQRWTHATHGPSNVTLRVERNDEGILALVVYGESAAELERFELEVAAAAYVAGALAAGAGVRFHG